MAIAALLADHARSGAADAVHADGLRSLPAALAGLARQPGSGRHATTPRSGTRSAGSSSGSTSRPAASCCGTRGRRSPPRVLLVATTVPVYLRLGSSSCRRSTRGRILYMPTTLPGHLGDRGAAALLQTQDRILRSFPEVERVFGKAGRAETSTDPAPFSMMETTVVLKPRAPVAREAALVLVLVAGVAGRRRLPPILARPDHRGGAASSEMDAALQHPRHHQRLDHAHQGAASTCSPPASARRSASRSPARTCAEIEAHRRATWRRACADVPGTRSVYAERVAGGYFLDFDLRRERAGPLRPHASTQAQDVILSAVGGENVTTTIEGRERYRVNVRYARELREDPDRAAPRPGADPGRRAGPAGADRRRAAGHGPAMIRNENGLLAGYVYVDFGRPRHRRLRGRGQAGGGRARCTLPAGLLAASGAASTRTCCGCASG